MSGNERLRLGEALAEAAAAPERAQRATANPMRAPFLQPIMSYPRPDHLKVPQWEQHAATTAMVTPLSLLLDGASWASIWRTGPAVEAPTVRKHFAVDDSEQLLGWLYNGTRSEGDIVRDRPACHSRSKITWSLAPEAL
ncbi:hypothetical protein [Streptomyces goshikiensis]